MHKTCIFVVAIIFSASVFSLERASHPTVKTLKVRSAIKPLADTESWYITGMVQSEDKHFINTVTVMDMKSNQLVFEDRNEETIDLKGRQGIHFRVGSAFLRYNNINHSWVFGVDKPQGFNLRLEALKPGPYPVNHLNKYSFYSIQSMRVNGELAVGGKSQFVVAKNAWLTHEWGQKLQTHTLLQRLLCRLDDGRGLMVFRAYDKQNVSYDLATLLEATGQSKPVSQFSLISQASPKLWQVSLIAPKMSFQIKTTMPQKINRRNELLYLYPGVIYEEGDASKGYCLISRDTIA